MNNTATISPSEFTYYAGHKSADLHSIVSRFTADAAFMAMNGATEMADAAMEIANAAWAQLAVRGEA